MAVPTGVGDAILALHDEFPEMLYKDIALKVGCAKATVSYHLGAKPRPEQAAKARREQRERLTRYVNDLKESAPCSDCGNHFPYWCMDFDHVRGEKAHNISRLTRGIGGMQRLLDEIAKCDLVCANCHRTRTQMRLIS